MVPKSSGEQNDNSPTVENVAVATTALLDNSVKNIRRLHVADKREADTAENLDTYLKQLAAIRELLQQIRFKDAFQTPAVCSALIKVKSVMLQLAQGLEDDICHPDRLIHRMDELSQATDNLRRQFPGDTSVASENKAERAFQANAAIGGKAPEGRLHTTASKNEAIDAVMINAPIYGDAPWLAAAFGKYMSPRD
jgi:hypothetical protein